MPSDVDGAIPAPARAERSFMHLCRLATRRVPGARGAAGMLVTLAVLVVASPAFAATTPVNLTVRNFTSTSFFCSRANPLLCKLTATGDVTSNLSTTPGTVEYKSVLDFSPGFDAPCEVVDETAVFNLSAGTLTTASHHRDCPATVSPGPRVNTTFAITGGTRAFAGASGGGTEQSSLAEPAAIVYEGQIAF
jgi:hypothetical protein